MSHCLQQYLTTDSRVSVCAPQFFRSEALTKLLIVLVLHPIILESAEALSRSTSTDDIANMFREGLITREVAEKRIVQGSNPSFFVKSQMAFYRRLMLISIGDPQATTIAIVAASLEEAFSRGFLVQIDEATHRPRPAPDHSRIRGGTFKIYINR